MEIVARRIVATEGLVVSKAAIRCAGAGGETALRAAMELMIQSIATALLDQRVETIEACARIADAYAAENIAMANDTILLDPVLSGKGLSPQNIAASEDQCIKGCIHSSMHHAAKNIAGAIRALSAGSGA